MSLGFCPEFCGFLPRLDPVPKVCYSQLVSRNTVSFLEIQNAHRKERAEDARALRTGKVSTRKLQERNSFIPAGATMRINDLAGYVKNRRAK